MHVIIYLITLQYDYNCIVDTKNKINTPNQNQNYYQDSHNIDDNLESHGNNCYYVIGNICNKCGQRMFSVLHCRNNYNKLWWCHYLRWNYGQMDNDRQMKKIWWYVMHIMQRKTTSHSLHGLDTMYQNLRCYQYHTIESV